MSRVNNEIIMNALTEILKDSQTAVRKHTETVELHINLQKYDPQKDKRFSGSISLPHITRPRMSVCMIADATHLNELSKKDLDIQIVSVDDIKNLKRNKKLTKKFRASADAFLASESLIKTIPRIMGPGRGQAGKFPSAVSHGDDIAKKVDKVRSTVKFQLKKVLNIGVVVGHTDMETQSLISNTTRAINFLVSLLKKRWANVESLYVKSTFGKPRRIL